MAANLPFIDAVREFTPLCVTVAEGAASFGQPMHQLCPAGTAVEEGQGHKMIKSQSVRVRLLACCALAGFVGLSGAAFAADTGNVQLAAQAPARPARLTPEQERQMLLQRLQQLETRLNQVESGRGMPTTPPATGLDTQAILDRLDQIDMRLSSLETGAVLSEPKINVKEITTYVDQNGNEYDQPGPGRQAQVTYQRERVFRRQSVDEAIEEALANQEATGINLGVSSVTTAQVGVPTRRGPGLPRTHVYGVSQADVTFLAKSAALNTSFFADLVGIGGSPPDQEIPAVSLLNSQTARLTNNALNLREAWVRTELGPNQLFAITVGQLDLTNYFDRNAVANDETTQFISDALVNNQTLGLINNGLGAVLVIDPKGSFNFKIGVQQSTPNATSLSQGLFSMAEVEYIAVPFGIGEGHYRLWGRLDNSTGDNHYAWGVSADQKILPTVTLFGRYGRGDISPGVPLDTTVFQVEFFSFGAGFQSPFSVNPLDKWGIGFAQTEVKHIDHEKIAEIFYNLHLTEHLEVSAMLQYAFEHGLDAKYLIPGTRIKVEF